MPESQTNPSILLPRVHDLLRLRAGTWAHVSDMPEWMQRSSTMETWAVVRRASAAQGNIPVGMRGQARHQRWGGFVTLDDVGAIVRPEDLRLAMTRSHRRSLPVFDALRRVEHAWSNSDVQWGPGGSVGYELATGEETASQQSDLDLILFCPQPTKRSNLEGLWRSLQNMPCKTDVRVETAVGGFALEEYVREAGRPILLRTITGPRLCVDPWLKEPAEDTTAGSR